MKHRKPRKKDTTPPLFQTLSIADVQKVSPESGTSIPSEQAVIHAKDWVDDNKQ